MREQRRSEVPAYNKGKSTILSEMLWRIPSWVVAVHQLTPIAGRC